MVTRITSEAKPILLWLDSVDQDTLQQARNLANLPFIHHHVAIMPDAHVGYGMPIGGVAATTGVVIPNAVGVDIGCGVHATQTNLRSLENAELKKIFKAIRTTIPLGFKHHKKAQPASLMPGLDHNVNEQDLPVVSREFDSGRHQLGTLGGGNHFIELQGGDDGFIWIMIHSGSRNIGYQVAHHYNKLAATHTRKHNPEIPAKWQLDALPLSSQSGQRYLTEMRYCAAFAAANRKEMMARVKEIVADFEPSVAFSTPLDVAHNYAAEERHFGSKVIVHRKGATRAELTDTGIIPGSQGSSSFIVRGRGNVESFSSCSHGAGRKLGRKQAQRSLDLQEEIKKLERRGILHSIRQKRDLDEAAGAYKNIDEVMANQQDLVEILIRLQPLGVVKG